MANTNPVDDGSLMHFYELDSYSKDALIGTFNARRYQDLVTGAYCVCNLNHKWSKAKVIHEIMQWQARRHNSGRTEQV